MGFLLWYILGRWLRRGQFYDIIPAFAGMMSWQRKASENFGISRLSVNFLKIVPYEGKMVNKYNA